MKATHHGTLLVALLLVASLAVASCGKGSSVEGNTYEGSGMKIVFKSGGIAITSLGTVTAQCSYSQDDKTVTLTCEGQKDVLTLADDKSLNSSQFGRLAKTS
jgi:hypothetical protein